MKLKIILAFLPLLCISFLVRAQWEFQNMDINNLNAPVEADGSLFRNTNTDAHFEAPKYSGKYCIFASNLWMGGLDQHGTLHLAAQTYKQNGTDYWPGPLTTAGIALPPSPWNKIWHVDRSAINNHIANYNTQGYQLPQDLIEWPGSNYNGINQIFAPFVDINNNGIYDPSYGDYPKVFGDEALYVMFNDKYDTHSESGSLPIEAEVYTTIYGYHTTGNPALDNTIFVRYNIRNRSQLNTYTDFYIGIWNDFEIGSHYDDLIGTDINRNMIYGYNAGTSDTIYGANPPAVGMKILNHQMHNSMFYNNTGTAAYGNNPTNQNHYYNYLRSFWKDETPLNYGLDGYQTSFGATDFFYSGNTNPNFTQAWNMATPKDYRAIGTTGPFTILPNGFITIDIAYVFTQNPTNNAVVELGTAADLVQDFYHATINSTNENTKEPGFICFPNPADDVLYISSDKLIEKNTRIFITDVTGKVVIDEQHIQNKLTTIDVSMLYPGIYFVTKSDGMGSLTQKFIKK